MNIDNKKSELSIYLKSKIEDKNISMYEVYKRLGGDHKFQTGGISYPQITRIFNGKQKNPRHETLKMLSKALNEPYSDLLRAAGYINEHDLAEVNSMLRDMLAPMFDDHVVDVLCDPVMIETLESILEAKEADRGELLRGLRTYARGFVAERKK